MVALSASAANAAIVNAAPVSLEAREARGGRNTAKIDAAGNILNGVSGIIDVGKSIWERLTTRDLDFVDEPIAQFAARDTNIWSRDVEDEESSDLESREARGGRNTAKVDAAGNILNGVSGILDVGRSIWDKLTSRDIVVDKDSLAAALASRDIVVDKDSLAKALASRDIDEDFLARLEGRSTVEEEEFLARLEGRDVSTLEEDFLARLEGRSTAEEEEFLARLEGREARNGANTAKVDAAGNLLNGVSGIVDTVKSFW